MPSLKDQVGVQSYCFRGFKENSEVADLVKKIGVSRLELCAVHINFNEPATFAKVIETYKSKGITIASIGVEGFNNNPEVEKNRFEFCKLSGAKVISCDFGLNNTPDSYRAAEKLADKYDVNLAIHNHGGQHWLGCGAMLEHVLKNTSPRIGICLDSAWALDSRENPVAMVEKFAARMYGAHIKDFIFNRNRSPEDVVVGTGNLDLPKFMKALGACPNLKSVVLEYEGDVNNPTPALTQCVEACKKATA
ncbi:MAG: sugar phosphate isomerase/epimerase [Planctomycetota bacterium]|nr:sugar phosphate isomerase/epimerase [Planctomycetota bacterium]